jgi:segregation and condensation protein B
MNLDAQIEALLFYTGEPMAKSKLASFCDVEVIDIENALVTLREKLTDRGIKLVEKEHEVLLATKKEMSEIIEKLRKDEVNKELSKASLETLSIILYSDKPTRADIDYIRGVNSSFILRNLMVRGLIEKTEHPDDARRFYYKPTFELLQWMGAGNVSELPEYDSLQKLFRGEIANEAEEQQA